MTRMSPGPGAMIKRTLEISQQPVHVSVRHQQLVLTPKANGSHAGIGPGRHDAKEAEPKSRRDPLAIIPCEDIGVLLVDQPAVTYSHAALTTLLDHEAAVILCGRDHLPAGLLLPIGEHSQVVWRIADQLAVSRPARKRLWQLIVKAKISAQAANLRPLSQTRTKLLALARNVRSGDPDNVEAQAARTYWAAWRQALAADLQEPAAAAQCAAFRRDPDGPSPNNLLNYGYAVMRAAVARAIVAAGLLPAIGIQHHSRSNAFCLADDLVEPLRPMVDHEVGVLMRAGNSDLSPDAKRGLLELLAAEVCTGDQCGPLMVGLHRYVASFVNGLHGKTPALEIPVSVRGEDVDAAEPLPET